MRQRDARVSRCLGVGTWGNRDAIAFVCRSAISTATASAFERKAFYRPICIGLMQPWCMKMTFKRLWMQLNLKFQPWRHVFRG